LPQNLVQGTFLIVVLRLIDQLLKDCAMDIQTLETLRTSHPAWRLLRADNGPLIVSFLVGCS
jgi:hypothetical protein